MSETDVLAGRYLRVATLGQGAMGEVWLATDQLLRRQVAIKRLRTPDTGDRDPILVERLLREARTAAVLQHPHVVAVHDLIVQDGEPFVVMEYVRGQTLAARVRQLGPLDPRDAARLLADVADALEAAHHQGILHRDIKPSNVMIDERGRAKLADFGIARAADFEDSELTGTGQFVGTVSYLAPEIAMGETATAAADVFSLGATLATAVDGRAPLESTGPGQTAARLLLRLVSDPVPVPAHAGPLTDLLSRMLAMRPADRPAIGAVRAALQQVGSRSAGSGVAPSATQPIDSADEVFETALLTQVRGVPSGLPTTSLEPSAPAAGQAQPAAHLPQPTATPALPPQDLDPRDPAPEAARPSRKLRYAAAVLGLLLIAALFTWTRSSGLALEDINAPGACARVTPDPRWVRSAPACGALPGAVWIANGSPVTVSCVVTGPAYRVSVNGDPATRNRYARLADGTHVPAALLWPADDDHGFGPC